MPIGEIVGVSGAGADLPEGDHPPICTSASAEDRGYRQGSPKGLPLCLRGSWLPTNSGLQAARNKEGRCGVAPLERGDRKPANAGLRQGKGVSPLELDIVPKGEWFKRCCRCCYQNFSDLFGEA